jgi:hypothetical protein
MIPELRALPSSVLLSSSPGDGDLSLSNGSLDIRHHRRPSGAGTRALSSAICVMGMTYGVHHGPSNMPAGVPGVPTASAREYRLRPKGRLRQQPASDSTEESWSRAIKTKLPNIVWRKVGWPQ